MNDDQEINQHHKVWDLFIGRGYHPVPISRPESWSNNQQSGIIPVGATMFTGDPRETSDPAQLDELTISEKLAICREIFRHPVMSCKNSESEYKRFFYWPGAKDIIVRTSYVELVSVPSVGPALDMQYGSSNYPVIKYRHEAIPIKLFLHNPDTYIKTMSEKFRDESAARRERKRDRAVRPRRFSAITELLRARR